LSLDEVLKIIDPVIQELRSSGLYNNQSLWPFVRCVAVMPFVDPPAAGIAKIRELISELRYRTYELRGVVTALGASRRDDALHLLKVNWLDSRTAICHQPNEFFSQKSSANSPTRKIACRDLASFAATARVFPTN
jgi:hypothetical protein